MDPSRPYNDLPKLPPKNLVESESVLRKLGDVKAALASLKEAGRKIPDQSVVLQAMALQEAKLSSEIENIFTTNDELYRQIEGGEEHQSPAVKEIRRYRHALWSGYEQLKTRKIDLELIHFLGKEILERDISFRVGPGTRIGNRRTGKIVYTPPEGQSRIIELLDNLIRYLEADATADHLVRIAVGHYQFEAIHPFEDGNGRTGRVLNLLAMVQHGVLDLPILYLSQEFLENRREYYERLREVTETGAWEAWVLFFLECVEMTAIITRRQFQQVEDAVADAKFRNQEAFGRSVPAEIIELIYTKPYCRISDLVQHGFAKRQTAALYLKRLESIGLVSSIRQWREILYLNDRLMDILSLKPDVS